MLVNQMLRRPDVETGKTEQDAIQKMQLWLFQNGYMGQQTVVINGQSSIEEFVEDFRVRSLMGSGISDRTFENYSYALKHFQDYFRGQRIGTIASEEMKRFLRGWSIMKKMGNTSTVKLLLTVLCML